MTNRKLLFLIIVMVLATTVYFVYQRSLYGKPPHSIRAGLMEIYYPESIRGVYQPAWAEFPQSITFIGTENSRHYKIYRLNVDRGEAETITPDYSILFYVFSQDRSKLAFSGQNLTTGDEGLSIYTMKDGSFQQAENGLGVPDAWSPDQTHLIVGGCENPHHACSFLYNIDTAQTEELGFNGRGKSLVDVAWSPDGEKITFIFGNPYENKNEYGLYVMHLPDQQFYKLVEAEDGVKISSPVWVQGGEWIVYHHEGPAYESQLVFVHAQKGDCRITPLSNIPPIDEFDVYEADGNLHFLLFDEDRRLLSLNFEEFLELESSSEIMQCQE